MLKNLLIWVAAIALAVISASTVMGAIAKNKAPAVALSMIPQNGFAVETEAARTVINLIAGEGGNFAIKLPKRPNEFAARAFVAEPLTPRAIAVLALNKAPDVRRELMRKALSLSRRESLITGWLIDDAAKREDLYALLDYYDFNLRTSSSSSSVLLPIMAGALANEQFIEPLARKLKHYPSWGFGFWNQLPGHVGAIRNAAILRQKLFDKNEDRKNFRDEPLIESLVRHGHFDKALELYTLLTGSNENFDQALKKQFPFTSNYPPMDWQLFATGEYGASINSGRLEISGIASSGGMLARRLITLPERIFQLQVDLEQPVPANTRLQINISCAGSQNDQILVAKIAITGSSGNQLLDNQNSSCSYHWLEIFAESDAGGDGFFFAIDSISLIAEP